jgi:hypothetical protein
VRIHARAVEQQDTRQGQADAEAGLARMARHESIERGAGAEQLIALECLECGQPFAPRAIGASRAETSTWFLTGAIGVTGATN